MMAVKLTILIIGAISGLESHLDAHIAIQAPPQ
jgi:hypothetical protein